MTLAISASQLVRTFGDKNAVDGVDISIAEGEIYGFLGPNGAGKSTMVKMLTSLLRPTSGSATVAGFDVAMQSDQVRLRIGVALQDAALDLKQTGREILDLQGRFYGLSKSERAARIEELIPLIDIGAAFDQRIGTYSGGMKRRLDLAVALVHNPAVLFLDEPTTGLDPTSRTKVWDEVRRLNTELGMTIFLTTQYLEEADVLANRVGIIAGGKIVAEGTPDELKRTVGTDVVVVRPVGDPAVVPGALSSVAGVESIDVRGHEVLVSVANGASAISPIALALNEAGVAVSNLMLRTSTLDDVFLTLTGGHLQEEAAA